MLLSLFRIVSDAPAAKTKKIALLLSSITGALLEIAGLAVIVPLLLLVLNERGSMGNKYFRYLYEVTGAGSYGTFLLIMMATVLLLVISKNIVLHVLNDYRTKRLLEIYASCSARLFRSYYSRGLLFIRNAGPLSLSHHVNSACYQYVFGLILPALTMMSDLLLIALILISLAWVNLWVAALELFLFAPVVLFFHLRVAGLLRNAGEAGHLAKKQQWRIAAEAFRGYPDIDVNGYFPGMEKTFREGIQKICTNKRQIERLKSLSSRSVEISLILMVAILVAGYYFFSGRDAGFLTVTGIFAAASLRLLPAVRSVIAQYGTLSNSSHTAAIIDDFGANAGSGKEKAAPLVFRHSIEFRNVSFGFTPGRPVLKNVCLSIKKGERIGIKGPSGVGKSTFLYLLMGLYEPGEGSIDIDGVTLSSENRKAWHRHVGYVAQEVFIINGSLEQNIVPSGAADHARMTAAIEQSALTGLAGKLNERISSETGENGSRLSGGEKQRVGIARAHYRGADVLIMDEPTSALDPDTEKEITANIEHQFLHKNLTIIVVSHRETILSKCDRIIELDKLA
jgi:ABC-type multidrug transport system fused ATPase/permease subunit